MAVEFAHVDPLTQLSLDLAKALKFTPGELAENRAKKISRSQITQLLRKALHPFVSSLLTLVGWIVFVQVVRMFIPGILAKLVLGKAVGGGAVIFLGCIGAVISGLFKSMKLTALLMLDVIRGESLCLEGRVSTSWTQENGHGLSRFHGEKHMTYFYLVKGREFEVPEQAYELLHSNYDMMRPSLRLHITPRSELLLSVEIF